MIPALRRDRNPLEGLDCARMHGFYARSGPSWWKNLSSVMTATNADRLDFVVPAQGRGPNPWRQSKRDRSPQSGLSSSIRGNTLSIFDDVYSFIAQRLHQLFNVFGHSQR